MHYIDLDGSVLSPAPYSLCCTCTLIEIVEHHLLSYTSEPLHADSEGSKPSGDLESCELSFYFLCKCRSFVLRHALGPTS